MRKFDRRRWPGLNSMPLLVFVSVPVVVILASLLWFQLRNVQAFEAELHQLRVALEQAKAPNSTTPPTPPLPPKDQLSLQTSYLALEKDRVNALNAIGGTLVQALGGIFFFVTAYLTWRNVRATEEKQVTERFSKAVEQLASDKLEVRLGGIYSLERVAQDSERDHWPIMEVLTSFVQSKVPARLALVPDPPARPTDADIQAVLVVIARRDTTKDPENRVIDLSDTHLAGIDLSEANLQKANLAGTNLAGANLVGTDLQGAGLVTAILKEALLSGADLRSADLAQADLSGAQLNKARLQQARLNGANLSEASLLGASLDKANLRGANLRGALLGDADLRAANLNEADLSAAYLMRAHLHQAKLRETIFEGATLKDAEFSEVDLREAIALTAEQLQTAHLTASTQLPPELTPGMHCDRPSNNA